MPTVFTRAVRAALRRRCDRGAVHHRLGADDVGAGCAGDAGHRCDDSGRRVGQHELQRLRHARHPRQRERTTICDAPW